jgi:hypothetical protein
MVHELRHCVRHNKAYYQDLNDNKYFNLWDLGFVATTYKHHTHLVMDKKYVPKYVPKRIMKFQEIQMFMYAFMEENLKSEKGMSLISKQVQITLQ